MIDPLATWQTTFANLPKVADTSWAQNFADWADARVTSKMKLNGIGGPNMTFTFNKSLFAAQLIALLPTDDALAGITGFALAWEAAIIASVAATAAGSYIGAPTPSTTWSVVNSTVIDPPSIALGKAKIIELKDAPATDNALDSEFPIKFREAFLLLTVTTDGLDSDGDGPYPLIDTARAVE
jgi:hypothetical protein